MKVNFTNQYKFYKMEKHAQVIDRVIPAVSGEFKLLSEKHLIHQ